MLKKKIGYLNYCFVALDYQNLLNFNKFKALFIVGQHIFVPLKYRVQHQLTLLEHFISIKYCQRLNVLNIYLFTSFRMFEIIDDV